MMIVCPTLKARSNLRIMSFWPNRTIWQFRDAWPSLCLNHEMPCNWGSMMRGHRAVFDTIDPFSVDTGSAGSVSWLVPRRDFLRRSQHRDGVE